MSERDELVRRLRAVENDWATTACYNGTRIEAASLLERDGAEIARLRVERDREERECGEVMDERDRYSDALAESHIALGGDGEWAARTWNPSPPDSGDLARDVPALAAAVKRDLDEARKALAEAREALARWLIAHGFATGHGDTLDDLLGELSWQVKERSAEAEALRKEAARADYVRKAFLLDDNDAIFEFCLAESVAEFNAAIDAVLATRVPDAAIAKEPVQVPAGECPYPVHKDRSIKACVEAGDCGCGARDDGTTREG